MGDAGEGLIDADARIQERMEELQHARARSRGHAVRDPEQARLLESLKLARTETARQLDSTSHDARRSQLSAALAELDRRIADASAKLG